jgi:hypothetical protein
VSVRRSDGIGSLRVRIVRGSIGMSGLRPYVYGAVCGLAGKTSAVDAAIRGFAAARRTAKTGADSVPITSHRTIRDPGNPYPLALLLVVIIRFTKECVIDLRHDPSVAEGSW